LAASMASRSATGVTVSLEDILRQSLSRSVSS
jgi:hypothetical protein